MLAPVLRSSPHQLPEALADSVLPAPPLHPGWEAEVARRVADMDAGRTRFVEADEALALLAARIDRRLPRP